MLERSLVDVCCLPLIVFGELGYLDEIGGKETVNVVGKEGVDRGGGGSSDALKLTVVCRWLGSGSRLTLPIDLLCGISGEIAAPIICRLLLQKNA